MVALKYLADVLTFLTQIESYTLPVRLRKGMRCKIRFNDMGIDSLVRFYEAVDEDHRFGLFQQDSEFTALWPRDASRACDYGLQLSV